MRMIGGPDEVGLRTVGIDVGSTTVQLVISDVVLRREGMSSRFVVVSREPVWLSPVALTPYRDADRIDEAALLAFVDEQYAEAGVSPADTDTGAVILTGTALLRSNARVAAELLSRHSGRLVCASAGHDYEARLAAHGAGAVALSLREGRRVLHVDIGGGTTKLALVDHGVVLDTAAIPVGARVVSWDDDRRVVQVDPGFVRTHGKVDGLRPGDVVTEGAEARLAALLCRELADAVAAVVEGRAPTGGLLTPTDLPWKADVMTFSGGVAEYISGPGTVHPGDLGRSMGAQLRGWPWPDSVPPVLADRGSGIRATALGAGQYSTQLSGSTIHVSGPDSLPLSGLPVVRVVADDFVGPDGLDVPGLAGHLAEASRRDPERTDGRLPLLALAWSAGPAYSALRSLAEAIDRAQRHLAERSGPLVVALDADLAQTLGRILVHEIGVARPVVCLDGVEVNELDYIDVGELIGAAGAVPVVVTSLLFPHPTTAGGTVDEH